MENVELQDTPPQAYFLLLLMFIITAMVVYLQYEKQKQKIERNKEKEYLNSWSIKEDEKW